MKGNFTSFQSNINHVGGVLQNYLNTGANSNVYVVLCGRFTPNQRKILQDKVNIDLKDFDTLVRWLISHGHPAYRDVQPPSECPKPHVIQEKETKHNTDEPQDEELEQKFEGGRFFFPDACEPTQEAGAFSDEHAFAQAMLQGTMPTLLFNGGNYASIRDLNIEDISPVCFPFGRGGINEH